MSGPGQQPPPGNGGGLPPGYNMSTMMAPPYASASQQPGSSSMYGMAPSMPPSSSSSSFGQSMEMMAPGSFGSVAANQFNSSDAAGLSAIHAPIDFGHMMGQGSVDFPPPLQQHQHYAMPAAPPMTAYSSSPSPFMPQQKPAQNSSGGEKQKKSTSKGKGKPKAKNVDTAVDGQAESVGTGTAKAAKPRKRKNAAVDREGGVTGEQDAGDAAVDRVDGNAESNRGKSAGKSRGAGRGGAAGGGGGGGGGGGSRRPSKAQIKQLQSQEGSTPVPQSGSGDLSRAGSTAPATPAATTLETGESTPTKRGGRGGGARSSRGGGGGGRRKGTAGRTSSRGSRATSARMTASVAPGTVDGAGTAAPDDGATVGEQNDDADEDDGGGGGGGEQDSSSDEGVDAGLEEDELDRQEAIQRQRSINMGPLMRAMSDDQQERYSAFRRHYLDKRFVRRLVYHLTRQTVTPQVATLVAGVGKVFIGEIVERARVVREEQLPGLSNDGGVPLEPEHLIEALRRYREDREVPGQFPPGAPNASAGVGGNGKRRRMF